MPQTEDSKPVIDEANVLLSLTTLLVTLELFRVASENLIANTEALKLHKESLELSHKQGRNNLYFYEQVLEKLDAILERLPVVE